MKHTLVKTMQARMALYHRIRNFFAEQNVEEVETPMLSPYGTTDVHLDSLVTAQETQRLYLHTSPEFAMKRLLSAGMGDCFQLGKVFRNEANSRRHRAEFTMLEWYRIGFSMYDLIDDVTALVKTVCPSWQDLPVQIISYAAAFARIGVDPHQDDLPTLKQKITALSGYEPQLDDERDEWLDFLLVTQIEQQLGNNQITFLTHYPASQAALSKKVLDDNGNWVAERFELYYQGIELANGFHELTNADEQRQRFEADNQQRQQLGKPVMPIDEDFIAALAQGMPACSGVALGVDRLLMLKLSASHIDEVMGLSYSMQDDD